jgi:hypothetical protein
MGLVADAPPRPGSVFYAPSKQICGANYKDSRLGMKIAIKTRSQRTINPLAYPKKYRRRQRALTEISLN